MPTQLFVDTTVTAITEIHAALGNPEVINLRRVCDKHDNNELVLNFVNVFLIKSK